VQQPGQLARPGARVLGQRGQQLELGHGQRVGGAGDPGSAAQRPAQPGLSLPPRRRPTAVFALNDLVALGFLQEVTRRGIRVPGDVAIVGYDDIDLAAAAVVPLTSVRQPRRQLGRAAARLLLEEATDGTHRHRQVIFQPELVIRQSSQPAAREDKSGM
jgi:LacI family transcriptional regulator